MSGVGLKVSRVGFDVDTASDKQLSFSSEWPLLPIEAEGDFTIEAPVGGGIVTVDIYEHELDYIPVFYAHRVSGDFFWPAWCYITDEKLFFSGYCDEDIEIKWKVFRRPLKTNFTAVSSDVTDATAEEDSDYGLLVSLPGKDISSTDKRDFAVRSDVRQLMIAQSGYNDNNISGETITHDLGYKPMYFLYSLNENPAVTNEYRLMTGASDFDISASTTELTWSSYSDPVKTAYIIFKDTLTTDG